MCEGEEKEKELVRRGERKHIKEAPKEERKGEGRRGEERSWDRKLRNASWEEVWRR